MKTLANIYYIGQIAFSASVVIWAICMAVRSLFTGGSLFVTICLMAVALTSYKLMFATSMREYTERKANHKQTEK